MKAELIQKEAAKLTAGIEDWELEDDLQDAFIEGALWAEKTIIDKACEWLEKKAILYVWENCEQGEHGIHKAMLEDFRKAMKGE